MTVGEKIREQRKKKGITQKQLAKKCGMFESAIGRIENSTGMPRFETVLKIADALDVDVLDLVDSKDDYLVAGLKTVKRFLDGDRDALESDDYQKFLDGIQANDLTALKIFLARHHINIGPTGESGIPGDDTRYVLSDEQIEYLGEKLSEDAKHFIRVNGTKKTD